MSREEFLRALSDFIRVFFAMVSAVSDFEAIDLVSLSFCGGIKVFGNLVFYFKDDFLVFEPAFPEATEAIFLIS